MFTRYRTVGLILKKIDMREADRLFIVYTKEFGRLELTAKAVRKIKSKLRFGLEVFCLSEVEFIQGKNSKTLIDVILINSFVNIKKDLNKLLMAYRMAEVADKLVREQEVDKDIWNLLLEVFKKLDSGSFSIETCELVYYYFVWNLLAILGYQMEVHYCSFCQRKLIPDSIYFNLKDKSLFCSQCQRELKVSKTLVLTPNVIKIIRIILEKDWSILEKLIVSKEDLKLLKKPTNYYLRHLE